MQKGQISIDLLITLAVVVVAIGVIGSITLTYSQEQEKSAVQQELQYTANKTASIITASGILADSNFRIETTTGKVFYSDENKNYRSAYPQISTPVAGTLNVSITINGQKQDANASFYLAQGITLDTTSAAATGKVVITHAN